MSNILSSSLQSLVPKSYYYQRGFSLDSSLNRQQRQTPTSNGSSNVMNGSASGSGYISYSTLGTKSTKSSTFTKINNRLVHFCPLNREIPLNQDTLNREFTVYFIYHLRVTAALYLHHHHVKTIPRVHIRL